MTVQVYHMRNIDELHLMRNIYIHTTTLAV